MIIKTCRAGAARATLLVLALVLGPASACDAQSGPSQAALSERNFSRVVDLDGQPTLRVSCEYVGKTPGDPADYISGHDYRRVDTDFYRLTLENLSANPLIIERVDYRLETGSITGEQAADATSLRRTWGTNVIAPGARISRGNNMVWSKASRNRLWKTYQFRIDDEDKSNRTFAVAVSLVYRR
ncbi:hypothetical protein THSYN_13720 [Candidatus Thiodictyon syntrophicum]|uniref:Uncharacterized protein n=1 Tax=Candidatus Thiodictyon syntrophicum TaxID=1166950 RepID=A0A2K8UA34_9GAMM|nr:hypothetical protein THSYN_13720 [Candidatus Thiodictyon syntrophicum]